MAPQHDRRRMTETSKRKKIKDISSSIYMCVRMLYLYVSVYIYRVYIYKMYIVWGVENGVTWSCLVFRCSRKSKKEWNRYALYFQANAIDRLKWLIFNSNTSIDRIVYYWVCDVVSMKNHRKKTVEIVRSRGVFVVMERR